MSKTIFIIGAGAAGFFSAIHQKINNPDSTVVIVEKSDEYLAKVKISGGGRCNVTHACFDMRDFANHYPRGAKELMGPLHRFGPRDTMDWFEQRGVPLKIESDNRVFPVSESSQSIIHALLSAATQLGVKLWTESTLSKVQVQADGFLLQLANGHDHLIQKLVLATGSSRSGHQLAAQLGHRIISPIPSLFSFKIDNKPLQDLAGISVQDVSVCLKTHPKKFQRGPLLITHWGISGPVVIRLSAWQAQTLNDSNYQAQILINYLPHLDVDACVEKLALYRQNHSRKLISTQSPFPEIPLRLWGVFVQEGLSSQIQTQTWESVSKKELHRLAHYLQQAEYQMTGRGVFKEEFVTCGGVDCNQINFNTMESKLVPGLHMVGELLNIDGVTGGFNFQNAWTTGYLSAQ